MTSRASLAASFAFAVLAAACGGVSPRGNEPAEGADTEAVATESELASCPNRQTVARPTHAEMAAVYAAFLARSGAGWNAAPPDWSWDLVTGSLELAYRTDAFGPKLATVSQATAKSLARSFLADRWDLLGYRSKGAALAASVTAEKPDPSYSGGGFAWTVHVDSEEPQSGYAGIESATQHLHFVVDVAEDGTVRQFTTADTQHVPRLTLSASPKRSASAARAQVLGLPMTHTAGPYEVNSGTTTNYGNVTTADIATSGLALLTDIATKSATLKLAHVFHIAHGDYRKTIYVDACTGKRISE